MENFDRIQDYLLGTMGEQERLLFEKDLAENEELATQLELQRFEMETIDQLEEDALRAKAKTLKARSDLSGTAEPEATLRQLKPVRSKTARWGMLAAAASVLLLIGFFFFQSPSRSPADAIALGYRQAQVDYTLASRSGEEPATAFDSRFIKVLQDRDQSKAGEAVRYFSIFPTPDPEVNIQAQFNLAHAHLLNEEPLKTIEILDYLYRSEEVNNRTKEELTYFKALALLETHTPLKGLRLLKQIVAENGRFAPAAKSVVKLLD